MRNGLARKVLVCVASVALVAPVLPPSSAEGSSTVVGSDDDGGWVAYSLSLTGGRFTAETTVTGEANLTGGMLVLTENDGDVVFGGSLLILNVSNGLRVRTEPPIGISHGHVDDGTPGRRGTLTLEFSLDVAPGEHTLFVSMAGDIETWNWKASAPPGSLVTGVEVGEDAFIHRFTDFTSVADAYALQSGIGARATVEGAMEITADETLVVDFAERNGLFAVDAYAHRMEKPDGSTELCPCWHPSPHGDDALGPGTYTFAVTGGAASILGGGDIILLGADMRVPS